MVTLLGEAKGVPYVLISWSSNARMAIFMEVYLKGVGVAGGRGSRKPRHTLARSGPSTKLPHGSGGHFWSTEVRFSVVTCSPVPGNICDPLCENQPYDRSAKGWFLH